MRAVQLFGFPKVYGMIATSNQWRLVCTDKIDATDGSDNDEKMMRAWEELRDIGRHPEKELDETNDERSSNDVVVKEPPKQSSGAYEENKPTPVMEIRVSPIYPNLDDSTKRTVKDGRVIAHMVTLFIAKACTTLKQFLDNMDCPLDTIKLHSQMPCRTLSASEKEHFAFGTVNLERLDLNAFNAKLETIHVIHHLGMGEYGNCCLGVSGSGASSCVVNFYRQAGKEQAIGMAQDEFDNWDKDYTTHRLWKDFAL